MRLYFFQLLTKTRLRELVKEVDPNEQLEEDVEELMLQISDDFVDELVRAACVFAKHRKSNIVEVKDVQLYLGNLQNYIKLIVIIILSTVVTETLVTL